MGEPIKNRNIVIKEVNGTYYHVVDPNQPLAGNPTYGPNHPEFGALSTSPNRELRREEMLEDQTDTPYSAGGRVFRKDAEGWYALHGECDGYEGIGPHWDDEDGCPGEADETTDTGYGRYDAENTQFLCSDCDEQAYLDW